MRFLREIHLCSSVFICGFLAFWTTASTAAEIHLKDDLGREVVMEHPAKRIVALAPFLTELAFSAGAGERVVGVSAFSDFPPEAEKLPQVATAAGLSLESLAALRPDLVLAWKDSVRPEEVALISRLGAAVFVAEARSLGDVPRILHAIGTLAGVDASGAARAYQEKLARVRAEYAKRTRVDVFLEIWSHPLTTISGRHFMNEALGICRARNVFDDLPGVAPEVSWEELYARDPAVIVGVGSALTEAGFRAEWRAHPTLRAVRSGHLVFVPPDRLQRPTARTPDGIAELCAALDRAR
ncbi:MAG TPA: cobalamin-binding protein [Usitatibacter sp.]|jgi:iron complex transport system substrate-binding protein|nr:cobalamin-binding protein [Usitatibacter sp.]